MKAICPECGELVPASKLTFPKSIKTNRDGEAYLCAPHEPKEGFKADQVVDAQSGEVFETFCYGAMRKPRVLIQEH